MSSILYSIAILLLIFALPYLITIWTVRHTVMRCMRVEPANAEALPEHLISIFKAAIAELERHEFEIASWHQIEHGSEKDGIQWGVLLQNEFGQTYAGIMTTQLVNSAAPLIVTFTTFFEDETLLTTINTQYFGIYSPAPHEIAQHTGNIPISEQWQRHQQKLAELSQGKQPQVLPVSKFLETLQTGQRDDVERLIKRKEIKWVKPGESYRMTWLTAIRAVYQVARKSKPSVQKPANSPAIAPSEPIPATPNLELEIAEFHRLQQKQKSSLSQRSKNWLLLGTLALFIASYSSVFSPERLLIFVAVLLLHEGGHVLAMRLFGYRDTMMLFIPFLGALATARKENASLTEKVWISLAGPLPGLILGIGLAITFGAVNSTNSSAAWFETTNWIRETSWMLIILNLFNLLPVYPLDGGQVADLLLFSRNPYLGVLFKGIGVLLLALLGLTNSLMLAFALIIALTIPASFQLAKLNVQFRKALRNLPDDNLDELLRFLFTYLQQPPYQSLPFAKKYNLVVGLLDTRREATAKWHVRTGLAGIYLFSLLAGCVGGLYSLMPNWTAWVTTISETIQAQENRHHRMQKEIETANQALKTNPQDEEAYLRRGRARLFLKDNEGAIADANQALKLNPNDGKAYQLRSLARRRLGDTAGATADQEKGLEVFINRELEEVSQRIGQNPRNTKAYLTRAGLYLSAKRYSEAIADCNQALLVEPHNFWAILSRGEAYLGLKKYPEALGNANHALKLNATSGEAYEFRSRVRRQMGDTTGAIADKQKASVLFQDQDDEL